MDQKKNIVFVDDYDEIVKLPLYDDNGRRIYYKKKKNNKKSVRLSYKLSTYQYHIYKNARRFVNAGALKKSVIGKAKYFYDQPEMFPKIDEGQVIRTNIGETDYNLLKEIIEREGLDMSVHQLYKILLMLTIVEDYGSIGITGPHNL